MAILAVVVVVVSAADDDDDDITTIDMSMVCELSELKIHNLMMMKRMHTKEKWRKRMILLFVFPINIVTHTKKIETIKIDLPLIESHINNTETTKQ